MIGFRSCLVGVFLLTCAVAGLYLARGFVLPAVAHWLDVGDPPRRTDYVMVLGGDQLFRPQLAGALVKAGLAPKVLVPVPISSPPMHGKFLSPAGDSMSAALLRCGMSACDIVILEKRVGSTYDEAVALAEFLQSRPDVRVTVVTSDYHTRRARWVFTQVLEKEQNRVFLVSAPASWVNADNWWRTESGLRTVCLEYRKLAYYVLRYGVLRYYAALGIILLVSIFARKHFRFHLSGGQRLSHYGGQD